MMYGCAGLRGASLGHLLHKERRHKVQRFCMMFVFSFQSEKTFFVLRPAVGLCRAICRRVPNLCICFACVAMFAFDAVFTGGRRCRLQSAVPRARGKEAMSVCVCAEQRLDGASVSRRSNACPSPARASALPHCRRTRSSLGAGSLVGFQLVPLSLVSPFSLSCSNRICVSFRSAAPLFLSLCRSLSSRCIQQTSHHQTESSPDSQCPLWQHISFFLFKFV